MRKGEKSHLTWKRKGKETKGSKGETRDRRYTGWGLEWIEGTRERREEDTYTRETVEEDEEKQERLVM